MTSAARLTFVALLLAAAPALASNGATPIAIGARAAGRGGADAAVADDAISQQLNPAGMLRLTGLRFDAGNMFVDARDRFENDRNNSFDSNVGLLAPALAAVFDPDSDFRVGFSVEFPMGSGSKKLVRSDVYPEGETEKTDFFVARIGPAFAWRPDPALRLGVGLYFNYLDFSTQSAATSSGGSAGGIVRLFRQSNGAPINPPQPILVQGQPVSFNELFSLARSPDSNSASLFKLSDAQAFAFSGNLGIQWDIVSWLTLAIAYTSPAYFSPLEGRADIDASQAVSAISSNPNIAAITGSLFDAFLPNGQNASFKARYHYKIEGFSAPQSASLGLAFWPTDSLLIASDFRWINWAAAFDTFDVKLTKGNNPDINEINGGDRIGSRVSPKWNDVYVLALGASWAATDWLVLRGGYNYSTSPIKKNRMGPGSPIQEHHLAAGFTVFPHERVGITTALVYALPEQQTNQVDPASPFFSFSRFKVDQLFFYLGVSVDL